MINQYKLMFIKKNASEDHFQPNAQSVIYGQWYPFAFKSSLGLCPWKLLQTKGYIWPYIPPLALIRIQYIEVFLNKFMLFLQDLLTSTMPKHWKLGISNFDKIVFILNSKYETGLFPVYFLAYCLLDIVVFHGNSLSDKIPQNRESLF